MARRQASPQPAASARKISSGWPPLLHSDLQHMLPSALYGYKLSVSLRWFCMLSYASLSMLLGCRQVFGRGEDALLTPDVIYAMKQGKVTAQRLQLQL